MTEEIYEKLKAELGEDLQQKVALKNYTSLGVGGDAEYFYVAKKIGDLVKAVTEAYRLKLPCFILGGGYNVVPSDQGFLGLVIKNECSNAAFSGDTSEVIVDSGLNLGKLINLAASRDFGGLEFLFGVPGTVGGAVYGNAGAFGYEISDFVKSIILLAPKAGEMTIIKKNKEWMNFSYRSTKLKEEYRNEKYKPIILTVKLQLVRRRRDEILGFMQENLKQKKISQPLDEKSAGSFFKNISRQKEESAGFLLEKAGAKKMKVGGASFSKKHANFLVNRKNATASDVRNLAEKAKDTVSQKFNKNLEEEIEYIGKW